VEKLIAEGRMTPAGMAAIKEAKANGEWDAAIAREDVTQIPPDLEAALHMRVSAWQAFLAWPASKKKGYLYWLANAKKAQTRRKRIQEIVSLAAGDLPN
jgi:uncharacterized protein YdeI (YjbR/CyaY-like superfamily)